MTDTASDTPEAAPEPKPLAMTAAATVRRLIREARFGTLATLDADGGPYASLVAVGTDPEGRPTLLISRLARHTQNIARDTRVSLMISDGGAADPLNAARASLVGRIVAAGDPLVRARYLGRHEAATGYADFKDFGFFRIDVDHAHLVEGFGRIVDVPGEKLITDWSGADDIRAAHDGIVSHMNADHAEAVALYATALAKAPDAAWRMVGIDPDGFEITSGEQVRHLIFPQRNNSVGEIRKSLVALVDEARKAKVA
ncbi:HugZ family pyridoxamine 5'-phosphate oxidase [Xanthobacter sediminis]|uniref:HugZ family pyridoxamine 5'-phosphate oxidase n=1 Tax=Xanthobacter sediminis TaxID=3119926 RepID=UPI003726F75B